MSSQVIRLKPHQYIHVLDNNTNVTFCLTGPLTFTVQDHQVVQGPPAEMIKIPPLHYVIISNPVVRGSDGKPVTDKNGQVKLRHGDEEVRQSQPPFPLYPGEKKQGNVSPLLVIAPDTGLHLVALRDFDDEEAGCKRRAGDEWLERGLKTYIPRVEVKIGTSGIVRSAVITSNQALRLKALKEFKKGDVLRKTGEEWLVREPGAYLPDVNEQIVKVVQAEVLSEKKALHLRALRTFVDHYGVTRKAGEEWLITKKQTEKHIPDVFEVVVGEVPITTLTSRQYCIVLDPLDSKGKPQLGTRELRKGETSFFLQPGERLESGIQAVHVLDSQEALLLRARESFKDGKTERSPGDRWMVYGPCEYIPPVTVDLIEKRRAIPLDANEGVYVRDVKSGRVYMKSGEVYMLSPYEELWDKHLPPLVEDLLTKDADQSSGSRVASTAPRDKSRVVTYKIPHNAAVQIYDYKEKRARVVFGPDLIMLGPDESFTLLSLSGSTPKQPKQLNVIALLLGPRFSTDVVVVETADHARLSLKLSYNWFFDVGEDRSNVPPERAAALFAVPDFIGDFCKAIASRVRGLVASQSFDNFHKNSADLIRQAVFGTDADGNVRNELIFKANFLHITNIDIQSVEPVDSRTRDALQKSVQLAIEITTKSQEAAARHEAERREQEARGRLERQKIDDEAEAEKSRKDLLQLQTQSMIVESTGQATADAKARSTTAEIEGKAAVSQAQLKAEAQKIKANTSLEFTKKSHTLEIAFKEKDTDLEIGLAKALADIEAKKFNEIVQAVGPATLKNIAEAGPELQRRLLKGLGLKSFMITDGNSPINVFSGAGGLIGAPNGN